MSIVACIILVLLAAADPARAAQVPTTLDDFEVPGTQVGDLTPGSLLTSTECRGCHGGYDVDNDPQSTWSTSLMAQGGRDPLFFAQMTTANQDAANVGYYCLRCHVPLSIVSGHAEQPDGSTLDAGDRDGVNCQDAWTSGYRVHRDIARAHIDVNVRTLRACRQCASACARRRARRSENPTPSDTKSDTGSESTESVASNCASRQSVPDGICTPLRAPHPLVVHYAA